MAQGIVAERDLAETLKSEYVFSLPRLTIRSSSPVVAHGDVHEDVAVVGIEAHHQRLLIFSALLADFGIM